MAALRALQVILGAANSRTKNGEFLVIRRSGCDLCLGVAIHAEDRVVHALANGGQSAAVALCEHLEVVLVAPFNDVCPGVDQPWQPGIIVLLVKENEGKKSCDVRKEMSLAGRVQFSVLCFYDNRVINESLCRVANALTKVRVGLCTSIVCLTQRIQFFQITVIPIDYAPEQCFVAGVDGNDCIQDDCPNAFRVFLYVRLSENGTIGNPPYVPLLQSQRPS